MSGPRSFDTLIDTPQGRLFARRWDPPQPSGAPIVLFHDSLGSVELWRDLPARLAARTGRSTITYDRLGFGRSDPHPGRLRPDFVADEARVALPHVLAAFGIERMALFGHSVGGGMAVMAAAQSADRAEAVIALSAQAFREDVTVAGLEQARITFADPAQVRRLQRYHGDKARWVLDAWIETWLAPSFADFSLDDGLRALRCPVLVVHGDQDEYGSSAHPDRIAALAAGSAMRVVIDGVGHMPHREQPATVLTLTADFLAGL